jgi:hypothetical protein
MSNWGSILGWIIVAALTITLMNYPVKLIYRLRISKLPASSRWRKAYSRIQQVIVQQHRFFALTATLALAAHVVLQLVYRWLSWTGLVAAALLVVNGFLGGYGHFVRKKKRSAWFYIHRSIAALAVLAILTHLLSRGL